MQLLQRLAQAAPRCLDERFVYLWGDAGAGKTHLLQAMAIEAMATNADVLYIAGNAEPAAFDYQREKILYLIDDCHLLSADAQIAAFNLFNPVREQGGCLIAAGTVEIGREHV